MKLLTPDNYDIRELAKVALDAKLYQATHWTLYRCYCDILYTDDIANSSKIILLEDDFDEIVGVAFFNEDYFSHYHYTNLQIYVHTTEREKGYGKLLYKEMNKYLINQDIKSMLITGSGNAASIEFWHKMRSLYEPNSTELLPMNTNWD